MSNYEDFKKLYRTQPLDAPDMSWESMVKKSRFLKKKLRITQLVLGLTIFILTFFFFYISAQDMLEVALPLAIMIGVLALRIVLEVVSMVWLQKLGYSETVDLFRKRAGRYHSFRTAVNLVATPVFYGTYIWQFIVLLPYFKVGLSPGFYLYVLISGLISLVVLGCYIGNDIRKELRLLKSLKR